MAHNYEYGLTGQVYQSTHHRKVDFCPIMDSKLPLMICIASFLGCIYIIATYLYVPALRQHPAGIMFGMSIYCAIYQVLFILNSFTTTTACTNLPFLVDFFLTGQETYLFIFAIDLLIALKNPFSGSKGMMKKYHICGGLWGLLCGFFTQYDSPYYAVFGFCWVHSKCQGGGFITSNTLSDDVESQGADTVLHANRKYTDTATVAIQQATVSGIFYGFYTFIVYLTGLIAFIRTWNTFVKGLPDTFKTRQRIQRHLKYYVGCYLGYWTTVFCLYAMLSLLPNTSNSDPPHNEKTGVNSLRCRGWHLLSCLLMAKGMLNALIWTRTSNILKIVEQLRTIGYVDLPPHEDSINWALRWEILTNTTKGICKSVDLAEEQARTSRYSSTSSVDENIGLSETYIHSRQMNESSIEYFDKGPEAYTQIETIYLENENENRHLGYASERVKFYDYAPHIFRRLRMDAQISCESYRNSMQTTTIERVSEGKSGAFFYFTEDFKYIVKTLTGEELKFLLSILPKYYTYITSHPDTFMTRFFGCHGLTMYGKTVFFVVMQSVFDTNLQIHERFDLKGSWVGRLEGRKPSGTVATCKFCGAEYVVNGSHGQICDVRRGEGILRHEYDQVGKDLNWNRHMALPRSVARAVAKQLIEDSTFLCEINCIDYSLLVGIHHRSFNVSHYSSAECTPSGSENKSMSSLWLNSNGAQSSGSEADSSCQQSIQYGGMSVDEVHGPGIYFMGLIDILQHWNCRKRIEHLFRAYILWQDKHGISIVNPRQYAERFQQRVIRELIYDRNLDNSTPSCVSDSNINQFETNLEGEESKRTHTTVAADYDECCAYSFGTDVDLNAASSQEESELIYRGSSKNKLNLETLKTEATGLSQSFAQFTDRIMAQSNKPNFISVPCSKRRSQSHPPNENSMPIYTTPIFGERMPRYRNLSGGNRLPRRSWGLEMDPRRTSDTAHVQIPTRRNYTCFYPDSITSSMILAGGISGSVNSSAMSQLSRGSSNLLLPSNSSEAPNRSSQSKFQVSLAPLQRQASYSNRFSTISVDTSNEEKSDHELPLQGSPSSPGSPRQSLVNISNQESAMDTVSLHSHTISMQVPNPTNSSCIRIAVHMDQCPSSSYGIMHTPQPSESSGI